VCNNRAAAVLLHAMLCYAMLQVQAVCQSRGLIRALKVALKVCPLDLTLGRRRVPSLSGSSNPQGPRVPSLAGRHRVIAPFPKNVNINIAIFSVTYRSMFHRVQS
jgi:hypothetical protein